MQLSERTRKPEEPETPSDSPDGEEKPRGKDRPKTPTFDPDADTEDETEGAATPPKMLT